MFYGIHGFGRFYCVDTILWFNIHLLRDYFWCGCSNLGFWYIEHPLELGWSSTSTADASSGIFTISWQVPFLILILGLPETLFDWGWNASNNAGWGPYRNGTPTENDGTGGSNTLYNYFGYYSTVSINITWTYFGGYA